MMLFGLGKEAVTKGIGVSGGTRATALWPGRGPLLICRLIQPVGLEHEGGQGVCACVCTRVCVCGLGSVPGPVWGLQVADGNSLMFF